jgi:hypothetical protein
MKVIVHRRDAEYAEGAQRVLYLLILCASSASCSVSAVNLFS